jgi:hypothetical protein
MLLGLSHIFESDKRPNKTLKPPSRPKSLTEALKKTILVLGDQSKAFGLKCPFESLMPAYA